MYYQHCYAEEMSRGDVLVLYKPSKNNLSQAKRRSEPTYNQAYVQKEVNDSNLKVDNTTFEKGYHQDWDFNAPKNLNKCKNDLK